MLICANKVKNDPARADQGCAQHVMTMPAHLPLSHLFTVQTGSQGSSHVHRMSMLTHLPFFTRIAPTDNMQPKSDDTKKHHRWLKG